MDKLSQARIQLLHPDLRALATDTFSKAELKLTGSAQARITATLRTFEEQDALYKLGRTVVNPDGKSKSKPMGNVVTNAKAGQSIHNYGLAIDFALIIDGQETSWNTVKDFDEDDIADWTEVVTIFKANGWEWGGDWKSFKDPPHFQFDFGYTWQQLQAKWNIGDQKDGYVNLKRAELNVANLYRAKAALNLRTAPSITSRKKKVILKGDYLSEISREGEWSNVLFEGIKGYVNNRYLVK